MRSHGLAGTTSTMGTSVLTWRTDAGRALAESLASSYHNPDIVDRMAPTLQAKINTADAAEVARLQQLAMQQQIAAQQQVQADQAAAQQRAAADAAAMLKAQQDAAKAAHDQAQQQIINAQLAQQAAAKAAAAAQTQAQAQQAAVSATQATQNLVQAQQTVNQAVVAHTIATQQLDQLAADTASDFVSTPSGGGFSVADYNRGNLPVDESNESSLRILGMSPVMLGLLGIAALVVVRK